MENRNIYNNIFWNIKIWLILGLVYFLFNVLFVGEGPQSPYWYLEFLLYGFMIFGIFANTKFDLRKKIEIPKKFAPLVYIFLVWMFGMIYELTLTIDGTGIGGVHPDTFSSFVLAQGDYITIAITSFFIIRYLRLSFREVFFLASGASLTEGLIFTGVLSATIFSPFFFLSPFILGYYILVYSSFIALPLLYINEELLWKEKIEPKKHSVLFFWILGFIVAFGIRIFWGLLYGPIVSKLFSLPPNII